MSIKLKQPTMQLVTLFNSLNKMTNAAYENAMRQCPRN